MFLPVTEARNRPLVDAAFALHGAGVLPPDTYVVDRDAVGRNAAALAEAGAAHGIELWFVVKQIGRNPMLIETIREHLPRAAAIDVREVDRLTAGGAALGNAGHLVQIPVRDLPRVLALRPSVVTVFDEANLRAVAAEARRQGHVQDVLLRIEGDPSVCYPGQEGGIALDQVEPLYRLARDLGGARVAGVTGFPCLLHSDEHGRPVPTPTLGRVRAAAELLRDLGVPDVVVDLPSASSVATLADLARWGATHAEPGHALTGTTPHHAVDHGLAEIPALVYLTEVAQHAAGRPLVFGGGFYSRGHVRSALIRTATGEVRASVLPAPAENIDYYRALEPAAGSGDLVHVGDGVVMAFRTQIFVTRSLVAVVSGLSAGAPRLDGLFDAVGRPVPLADVRPGAVFPPGWARDAVALDLDDGR